MFYKFSNLLFLKNDLINLINLLIFNLKLIIKVYYHLGLNSYNQNIKIIRTKLNKCT